MLQESNKVLKRHSNEEGVDNLRRKSYGLLYYKKFLLSKCKIKRLQRRREAQLKLQVLEEQELDDFDIFHRAINTCIFFSHIFGIMPLKDTLHTNPNQLKFQLKCMPMLCTACFILCGSWKFMYFSSKLFEAGVNPKNVVGMVFFFLSLVAIFQFIGLAKNWPALVRYWTRVEMIFLLPPYQPLGWTLKRKLLVTAGCFGLVALGKFILWMIHEINYWLEQMQRVPNSTSDETARSDHILYYASLYTNYRMKALHCEVEKSKACFSHFIRAEFQDVFNILPFNIFSSIFAFFLNANFTYIWNYMDLFIMLVGISLATRLQQFNQRLQKLKRLPIPDALWYDIRQHHTQLCELLECIDENISSIILIAAMNDMYFICNHLLNIFTKLRWPINYIYRWYSLIFIIGRTACSFMCAAAIHDASLEPLKVLYLVPPGYWTEEVQRFMAQLTNQCIALTGKRFYHVTRKSLFGFFATIITYELVLLQLDRNSHSAALPNICD